MVLETICVSEKESTRCGSVSKFSKSQKTMMLGDGMDAEIKGKYTTAWFTAATELYGQENTSKSI